jgi:hypothetical protein
MAPTSSQQLLALNGVRLKGFAETGAVALACGLSESAVATVLGELRDTGLAQYREGRVSGWTVTSAGREEHARLIAAELYDAGSGPEVDAAYQEFLALNPRLLTTASAWQMRDHDGHMVMNDHSDQAYDQAVLADLRHLHADALPLAARLAGLLARFGCYGPRLSEALVRIDAGEYDFFTKPLIDSYHTVWFELHEDLLSTLGRERSSEETKESA